MNRITVEQIVNAYKETGLRPQRFTMSPIGKGACCGLGIIAFKEIGIEMEILGGPRKALNNLGLSNDYINGFIRGFDKYAQYSNPNDEHRAGWSDGYNAAKTVFGE